MATYVTSLHGLARVSHVGTQHRTACGMIFTGRFQVTEAPIYRVCARCAERAPGLGDFTLLDPGSRTAARDARIVALLLEGLDNLGIAERTRWGLRTTVRHVNDAQARAGATTRFQWGVFVGRGQRG